MQAWSDVGLKGGHGDQEERTNLEEAESKEFPNSVPKDIRKTMGLDSELLHGFKVSFLRQIGRAGLWQGDVSWDICAPGLSVCGQTALSCIPGFF